MYITDFYKLYISKTFNNNVMGELTRIIDEAITNAKKEAQEAMKANLVVFLKEKYDITLTDDEWQHVIHD